MNTVGSLRGFEMTRNSSTLILIFSQIPEMAESEWFKEPKPMGINKTKYPSISGHLNVVCPLAPSLSRVALFSTLAAFTCCWSCTLSLLWGFGSCLMKEWGPNSPHWEEKANNSVNGCFKNFSLISCLQKILKPKCWSTLATSPNWIF